MNTALDNQFAMPGDAAFPLNQAFEAPRDRQDAETLRQYLSQVRQELAIRLLARLYAGNSTTPSKVCGPWSPSGRVKNVLMRFRVVVAKFHQTEIHGEIVMRHVEYMTSRPNQDRTCQARSLGSEHSMS